MNDVIEAVEANAYDAWPAAEVADLGGWRLRCTQGVTRRGNSVWTCRDNGTLSSAERIERVEEWYAKRGLPVVFQMTPFARPAGLDEFLRVRGYGWHAPSSVQIASAHEVATFDGRVGTRVDAELLPEWFEVSAMKGRFAPFVDVYRNLLRRIGSSARYALVERNGQPIAVGLGVIGEGWMGIFSMLTVPEHRRTGAGRRVLSALAQCAVEFGVESLYLQVEGDNLGAQALYRAASFRDLYGYHYRISR